MFSPHMWSTAFFAEHFFTHTDEIIAGRMVYCVVKQDAYMAGSVTGQGA